MTAVQTLAPSAAPRCAALWCEACRPDHDSVFVLRTIDLRCCLCPPLPSLRPSLPSSPRVLLPRTLDVIPQEK